LVQASSRREKLVQQAAEEKNLPVSLQLIPEQGLYLLFFAILGHKILSSGAADSVLPASHTSSMCWMILFKQGFCSRSMCWMILFKQQL
jgi:hypothetical protein